MAQKPEQEAVAEQYKTSDNLNARIQLHARFSLNTTPWHQWIFDNIALPPDGHVLELGCGPGTLWVENQARVPAGVRLVLSDFSPGMLAAARRNLANFIDTSPPIGGPGMDTSPPIGGPGMDTSPPTGGIGMDTSPPSGGIEGGNVACRNSLTFEVVDAQAIPFETAQFDVVMAHHMLYHVPDRAKALGEICRVLKPGGTFYASTVGESHLQELWELVEAFAPGTLASTQRVSQGFTLENGAAQLARWFDDVRVYFYEDGLVVTEAEPLIAYVKSSLTMGMQAAFSAEREAAFADEVKRRIAQEGEIRITKASGLFMAM